MKDISQIDKNFKVETKLDIPNVRFYNVLEEPFKVYGVYHEKDKFRRMSEDVAKTVSEGVYWLNFCTAGDGVHPTAHGHEIIKRLWLETFEKIK